MILITKGQENTVVLTLKEKTTLSSPYYLIEFKNDSSKSKVYCIASDTSTQKDRYNKFSITETTDPNNLSGEVELNPVGFWTYTVREQESSTNLDPSLSGAVVEVGKVKVVGAEESVTVYNDQEQTIIVYESND